MSDPTPDASAQLAALLALREEHRPILARLLADAGIEPATRRELVEHLLEEEDEHLALLAGQLGLPVPADFAPADLAPASRGPAPGAGPAATPDSPGADPRSSVGSLRPDPTPIWEGAGIGSPRPRGPAVPASPDSQP